MKIAAKTVTSVDDHLIKSIKKYVMPALYFTALYFSLKLLDIGDEALKIINMVVLAVVMIMGALLASSFIVMVFNKYWENKRKDANKELAIKTLSGLLKIVIWIVAVILFLENVGIRINSLIAGVGIGGIAIAFAAQSFLGDIFCFFTIFFDRPFEIGDFIVAGKQMGTVEYIGLKTTRLRTLDGEQLIFSNTDLTGSRISNFKSMQQRRVLFTIGVTYDTPHEKLAQIPALLRSVIEGVENTQFARSHFASYGDYSLRFETAYFILSSDYDMYMDIHQKVNLGIKEAFEKHEIEFAYPTQTVQLAGAGD
jgi:small-conductance mechanosensitive channel